MSEHIKLKVKVHPQSSMSLVKKIDESNYEVLVTTPAVDNQANESLIKLLAKYFKVAKSCIKIVSGATSKNKMVKVVQN